MSDHGRTRAYSHTRTNSSSSASSGGTSLVARTDDLLSDTSSTGYSESHVTPSEAAAQAALKNVKNIHITSANRFRSLPEDPASDAGPSRLSTKLSNSSLSNQTANKLSNVAASAAAFASRPKGNMFNRQKGKQVPASNSSGNSKKPAFGLSNKSSNADLTIQTNIPVLPIPSISDKSPLSRTSKELERIASISNLAQDAAEKTKHHISFRARKDTLSGVLSSSASNSKLVSEQGSLYSFQPSSPSIQMLDLRNLANIKEDRDQIADSSWALLWTRVSPVFSGEELRVPVEDLNNLVKVHLQLLIPQGNTAKEIVSEFETFLNMGFNGNELWEQGLQGADLLVSLVDSWTVFFTKSLPYLQAVFLPLQMEFDGHGKILTRDAAAEFWSSAVDKSKENLNTCRLILIAYRDNVIIPVIQHLDLALSKIYVDTGRDVSGPDLAIRIMQCANVLASIQSHDTNQEYIDRLIKMLKNNLLSGSRTSKNRRGFVSQKISTW